MKNQIRKILEIYDESFDEIIQAYINGQLSIDAFKFYTSLLYNVNDTVINELEKYLLPTINTFDTTLDNPPLISVIIPTYNRKDMLIECIDSVLNQSYKNIEIIIIDDCSKDGTNDAINSRYYNLQNIRYIRNSANKNAGYNRNLGYSISNGQYIIFLDDDDYYIDRNYFYKAIKKHLEYKDLSFVCANTLIHNILTNKTNISIMNVKGLMNSEEYLQNFDFKYDKAVSTFTAVFKKSILEQADFKNMKMMNDTSIYLRALLYNQVYIFDDIIGVYRIHSVNISNNLSLDFIIRNLEEKMWVYQRIRDRGNREKIISASKWIFMQLMTTIRYYIYENKPDFKTVSKLLIWVFKNGNDVKLKLYMNILKVWLHSLILRKK